jgi:predicted nucleic acid-binding protein
MKKPADKQVVDWYVAREVETWICAPALAEIAFGITRLPIGKRRSGLEANLSDLRVRFAERTLTFTAVSAMIYGDVMFDALNAKHNMSVIDGQIAAIAIEQEAQLATRNVKDFKFVSVDVINPWEAA